MDKKTKAYAKRKAKAIKRDIGYNPELYKNVAHLDREYSHVSRKLKKRFVGYVSKSWEYAL